MLEGLGAKKEFVRSVAQAKIKDNLHKDIVKKNFQSEAADAPIDMRSDSEAPSPSDDP